MNILISLGEIPSIRQRARLLGLVVRPMLEAAVQANQVILSTHHVPPLYESGVRYREEPRGQGYEEFALIPVVFARKWGDCDDLAPWRVAELRQKGEKAKVRITFRRQSSGFQLYHVLVRRAPSAGYPRGQIEDPSRVLGMS